MAGVPAFSINPQTMGASGFAVIGAVVNPQTIASLSRHLEGLRESDAVRRKAGGLFGIRDLLNVVPAVRNVAEVDSIKTLVKATIGNSAKLVRGLFFDKSAAVNWKVSWHQDLTIAVRERRDVPGFGKWTIKAGTPHVQPPATVLERMVAIRIHLDDTDQFNGALKVIPGSHLFGRLSQNQIQEMIAEARTVICDVASGGVVVMRPLLLHSSSAGSKPGHRRVIHLEFAAVELPGGLEWAT
jgi:ectoine hydroxylase-related dioxygenase (phytanoyl-CoA dioxygenase family)